jgi:hypothetical protein
MAKLLGSIVSPKFSSLGMSILLGHHFYTQVVVKQACVKILLFKHLIKIMIVGVL